MINGGMKKINGRQKYQKQDDRRQTAPRKYDKKMTDQVTNRNIHTRNQKTEDQTSSFKMNPILHLSCFGCGSEGHLKRNCPKVYCFYCGKRGHLKRCCSFYSSYLSTRASLGSEAIKDSKINKKLINLECSNRKSIEIISQPQKKEEYLLIKEFNSYKDRIENALKDLEAALSSLKKNSEALSKDLSKVEKTTRNVVESHDRLEEDHIAMASAYE